MRTKEEILQNQKHGFNSGQKESALNAMQQYADEFACAFAEWIIESKYKVVSIKKGIIYSDEDIVKPDSVIEFYTTTELLEIFKKEINGKV